MKFTAQEEYGLRCLIQVARAPSGFVTVPEIAAREGITKAYASKLLRGLREAGFVRSARGQRGGYELAKQADEVTVASVLAAMGGRLYSNNFCQRYSGQHDQCTHSIDCSIRALWGSLDFIIHQAMSKVTLGQLLCSESQMQIWLDDNAPWEQNSPRLAGELEAVSAD